VQAQTRLACSPALLFHRIHQAKEPAMEIGKLHVVLVHFPIALAFSAILAEVLWLATRRHTFAEAGVYCLVLAAVSAVPVVITGLLVAKSMEFVGSEVSIVSAHKYWGIAALVFAVLSAIVRLVHRERPAKWWLIGYCASLVVLGVCMALAGHYGGMLVHGKNFLSSVF